MRPVGIVRRGWGRFSGRCFELPFSFFFFDFFFHLAFFGFFFRFALYSRFPFLRLATFLAFLSYFPFCFLDPRRRNRGFRRRPTSASADSGGNRNA